MVPTAILSIVLDVLAIRDLYIWTELKCADKLKKKSHKVHFECTHYWLQTIGQQDKFDKL